MNFRKATAERRIALYNQRSSLQAAYREKAYGILGGKCAICGSVETLRHRFYDASHLLVARTRTNPISLFRCLFRKPELAENLYLICRECRIAHRTPAPKPLDISMNEGSR